MLKEWGRALRLHQWTKNLLVFVPALTAHMLTADHLVTLAFAFLSFSFCASSVYIFNDARDVGHDRLHPHKRHRPFASGAIALPPAMLGLLITFALSLLLAFEVSLSFLLILILYYLLAISYTVVFKRFALLDVIMLAGLYTLRVIAGGAAVGITVSPWLLLFSMFFFFYLAVIKRCAELAEQIRQDLCDPTGRGYRLADLPLLEGIAAVSGYLSVLIFGLYLNSDTVVALYSNPTWLYGIMVVLLYWVTRILLLTHRGEMHEDPVLFAWRDESSIFCAGAVLFIMMLCI